MQIAHQAAVVPLPELVEQLRDVLGVRLVAYLANVKNTRPVGDWAEGRRRPGADDEQRLRLAFQAALVLRDHYSATTVQSWMMGSNPALGDEAPARFIRTMHPIEAARELMAAANAFANLG